LFKVFIIIDKYIKLGNFVGDLDLVEKFSQEGDLKPILEKI